MKQLPVKKNEIYTVTIMDLTFEAYGVAKVDGFTIFVESVLPQEIVEIRIEKVEKRYAYGKVLTIIKASPDRVDLIDPLATRIGTMPLQHLSYQAQLQFKRQQVLRCFQRFCPVEETLVLPTIGMEHPWEYRNKAQIPVREVNGQLETGFFKRNSHDLVPIQRFYIQDPQIDHAIIVVRDILRNHQLTAYDEGNHTGFIRHIIVRKGHYSLEMMIILVTNGQEFDQQEKVVSDIIKQLPHVVSVIQNINEQQTNVIMGKTNHVLYGKDRYQDQLLGKAFNISAHSFFQVNTKQTEVLYSKALEYARIHPEDVVIDAYCGIGTISIIAANQAKTVYGVELVSDAIKMAKVNGKLNNVDNVIFETGKAEDVIEVWIEQEINPDVLIVDPPRKGLANSFIESSIKLNPKRIVYISCNPMTLAKDVKAYVDQGYIVEAIQPVDMFPHTTHVETVVLLSRVDK